jgi:uncharacterized protein YacL
VLVYLAAAVLGAVVAAALSVPVQEALQGACEDMPGSLCAAPVPSLAATVVGVVLGAVAARLLDRGSRD